MCRNQVAQTQNMTMYGNDGRLWWLLCAGSERMVITVCLVRTPWENMFFLRLFFFFFYRATSWWHCQRLSRVHCASTHRDNSRLKSWAEALLNVLPLLLHGCVAHGRRASTKNTQRGELFSRRHGRTRLRNRWHPGEDTVIENYMGAFRRCVHFIVAWPLSVYALTQQAQWQ